MAHPILKELANGTEFVLLKGFPLTVVASSNGRYALLDKDTGSVYPHVDFAMRNGDLEITDRKCNRRVVIENFGLIDEDGGFNTFIVDFEKYLQDPVKNCGLTSGIIHEMDLAREAEEAARGADAKSGDDMDAKGGGTRQAKESSKSKDSGDGKAKEGKSSKSKEAKDAKGGKSAKESNESRKTGDNGKPGKSTGKDGEGDGEGSTTASVMSQLMGAGGVVGGAKVAEKYLADDKDEDEFKERDGKSTTVKDFAPDFGEGSDEGGKDTHESSSKEDSQSAKDETTPSSKDGQGGKAAMDSNKDSSGSRPAQSTDGGRESANADASASRGDANEAGAPKAKPGENPSKDKGKDKDGSVSKMGDEDSPSQTEGKTVRTAFAGMAAGVVSASAKDVASSSSGDSSAKTLDDAANGEKSTNKKTMGTQDSQGAAVAKEAMKPTGESEKDSGTSNNSEGQPGNEGVAGPASSDSTGSLEPADEETIKDSIKAAISPKSSSSSTDSTRAANVQDSGTDAGQEPQSKDESSKGREEADGSANEDGKSKAALAAAALATMGTASTARDSSSKEEAESAVGESTSSGDADSAKDEGEKANGPLRKAASEEARKDSQSSSPKESTSASKSSSAVEDADDKAAQADVDDSDVAITALDRIKAKKEAMLAAALKDEGYSDEEIRKLLASGDLAHIQKLLDEKEDKLNKDKEKKSQINDRIAWALLLAIFAGGIFLGHWALKDGSNLVKLKKVLSLGLWVENKPGVAAIVKDAKFEKNGLIHSTIVDRENVYSAPHYVWLRDGEPIPGQDGSWKEYMVGPEDAGRRISLLVNYVDGKNGRESATSNALKVPTDLDFRAMAIGEGPWRAMRIASLPPLMGEDGFGVASCFGDNEVDLSELHFGGLINGVAKESIKDGKLALAVKRADGSAFPGAQPIELPLSGSSFEERAIESKGELWSYKVDGPTMEKLLAPVIAEFANKGESANQGAGAGANGSFILELVESSTGSKIDYPLRLAAGADGLATVENFGKNGVEFTPSVFAEGLTVVAKSDRVVAHKGDFSMFIRNLTTGEVERVPFNSVDFPESHLENKIMLSPIVDDKSSISVRENMDDGAISAEDAKASVDVPVVKAGSDGSKVIGGSVESAKKALPSQVAKALPKKEAQGTMMAVWLSPFYLDRLKDKGFLKSGDKFETGFNVSLLETCGGTGSFTIKEPQSVPYPDAPKISQGDLLTISASILAQKNPPFAMWFDPRTVALKWARLWNEAKGNKFALSFPDDGNTGATIYGTGPKAAGSSDRWVKLEIGAGYSRNVRMADDGSWKVEVLPGDLLKLDHDGDYMSVPVRAWYFEGTTMAGYDESSITLDPTDGIELRFLPVSYDNRLAPGELVGANIMGTSRGVEPGSEIDLVLRLPVKIMDDLVANHKDLVEPLLADFLAGKPGDASAESNDAGVRKFDRALVLKGKVGFGGTWSFNLGDRLGTALKESFDSALTAGAPQDRMEGKFGDVSLLAMMEARIPGSNIGIGLNLEVTRAGLQFDRPVEVLRQNMSLKEAGELYGVISRNDAGDVEGIPAYDHPKGSTSITRQSYDFATNERLKKNLTALNAFRRYNEFQPLSLLPNRQSEHAEAYRQAAQRVVMAIIANNPDPFSYDPPRFWLTHSLESYDNQPIKEDEPRDNQWGTATQGLVTSGINIQTRDNPFVSRFVSENDDIGGASGYSSVGHRLSMINPTLQYTVIGLATTPDKVVKASAYRTRTRPFSSLSYHNPGKRDMHDDSGVGLPESFEWPSSGYFPKDMIPFNVWHVSFLQPAIKSGESKGVKAVVTFYKNGVKMGQRDVHIHEFSDDLLGSRPSSLQSMAGFHNILFQRPDDGGLLKSLTGDDILTYSFKFDIGGFKLKEGASAPDFTLRYDVDIFNEMENGAMKGVNVIYRKIPEGSLGDLSPRRIVDDKPETGEDKKD